MDDPIEIKCKVLKTGRRLWEGQVREWSTVAASDPSDGLTQRFNVPGEFPLGAELTIEVRLVLPVESEVANG